ncbi:hypothetical protein ACN47E_005786 [Coniothyrium glycines]
MPQWVATIHLGRQELTISDKTPQRHATSQPTAHVLNTPHHSRPLPTLALPPLHFTLREHRSTKRAPNNNMTQPLDHSTELKPAKSPNILTVLESSPGPSDTLDGCTSAASPAPDSVRRNLRSRLARFFSRKKTEPALDDYNGDVEMPDPSPPRVLTSRSTDAIPSTPKSSKSRAISFRSRSSKNGGPSSASKDKGKGKSPQPKAGVASSGSMTGHVSVTDMLVAESAVPQDNVSLEKAAKDVMPTTPSKEAALTSHPVKGKEASGSSEGKFETPAEEMKGKRGMLDGK